MYLTQKKFRNVCKYHSVVSHSCNGHKKEGGIDKLANEFNYLSEEDEFHKLTRLQVYNVCDDISYIFVV